MEENDWLEKIQRKYAVTFESVDTSALKRVILQNACFISELFLRNYEIQLHNKRHEPQPHEKNKQSDAAVELPEEIKKHTEGYILRRPWLTEAIRQDLILLENQLPYSVLTDLFDFMFKQTPVNVPTYLPKLNEKSVRDDFICIIAAEFFLEYYKFGRSPASGAAATTAKAAAAASKSTFLAGVKFRRGDKEARLTDIKKKGGLCWLNGCCLDLQFPELSVKDDTECIMRNVMALEQFVYPREPFICNYVFLLDQLISTQGDVQFLIDKKIVSNWLGNSDAVVDLVNKLCDQIVVSNFFYNQLCEELNKHHENALNVFRATLNRVYFKDLFTISSTAVAAFFLVFSIFSTWLTIKNLFC
ncbi:uncharacterized protein LOC107435923 [Ziziphus jujuba]|uniref:Uncharacterized protein LOC107435923 n=1 Tax=Ziziphus jujuba TaxID=326968 RepID=A0ABM4ADL9_ZIZJJ|nr:uncharacterized protein LOC107435923 [Ziziphus jujuba]